MKTAEDHLLRGQKYTSPDDALMDMSAGEVIECMKSYAEQCIKEHLSRAAENAGILQVDTEYNYQTGRRDPVYDVDRESITNIDIKIP